MRESAVEKAFVDAVRKAGGAALKFTSQSRNGVPDRLVLFFSGKAAIEALKEWNPGEPIPTGVGVQVPEIENAELPTKDTEAGKGDDAR